MMSRAEHANLFEVVADGQPLSEDSTRIGELCAELDTYLEPRQVDEVYRAYLLGARAHEGQSRVSGEPYISHPVAVAKILSEMRMELTSSMRFRCQGRHSEMKWITCQMI